MEKWSERNKVIWQDLDPSAADTLALGLLNKATWINVENYHQVTCIIFRTVGTGNVLNAALYAATAAAGTGSTQITTSGSTAACGLLNVAVGCNDGTGNRGAGMIVLETHSNEMSATLANSTHIQCKVAADTGTDEFGVCWILSHPRYGQGGLTSSGNGSSDGYAI